LLGVVERFGKETVTLVESQGSAEVTLRDGFTFTLTNAALTGRLQLDMGRVARSIPASVRVLTVHGADDQTIPVADAHEFDKLVSNHVLAVIPGASHNFSGNEREVASHIRDVYLQTIRFDEPASLTT
jgi:uncharacterized protein